MAVLVVLGLVTSAGAATIATFADPALNGTTPLFTVDVIGGQITGGWSDARTGLNLHLPVPGPNPPGIEVYNNAWFTMTPLAYAGTLASGTTGPGTIEFFADGTVGPVLLRITFDSAQVDYSPGFGADNIISMNNVAFSGQETTNWGPTSDESFSFTFVNKEYLGAGPNYTGYTATASFTASALPEPATCLLMSLVGTWLLRRRTA